ncbi:hypothetical protein HDU84_006855 [Entophlyctis sp. JEL0112]|nr:hypothetical protein HDU84_006855 [Entophlyctis sp. JEL0112]
MGCIGHQTLKSTTVVVMVDMGTEHKRRGVATRKSAAEVWHQKRANLFDHVFIFGNVLGKLSFNRRVINEGLVPPVVSSSPCTAAAYVEIPTQDHE